MDAPAVSIEGVHKSFGDTHVLKGIDLQLGKGEILAVMGSSGGGKTTLLKCISGLLIPDEGRVLVAGIEVDKDPEEARRKMGMVFQSAALFDFLNVKDNVSFGVTRRRTKMGVAEIVRDALDKVGLDGVDELMPSELSGGMRKRVGIARALALKPEVMLYDEPTTGLDPITTYTIDSLIVQLRKELGVSSVVVSHDVNSVCRVADRIAFLHQGRVEFLGTPAEFQKDEHASIRELVTKAQAITL